MKVLILCNGEPPTRDRFIRTLARCDRLIAADGGANVARGYGRMPDVVVGDMDSFSPEGGEPFEVIVDRDQETNDLEKALAVALRKGATEAVILGATGRRVDQTLKNLSVLKQFDSRFDRLLLRDNHGDTWLLPPTVTLELPVGRLVSLFPLSGTVTDIVTKGLKYPLRSESLENGVRDGSSNRVSSERVTISHGSGDLLIFIAHDPDRENPNPETARL